MRTLRLYIIFAIITFLWSPYVAIGQSDTEFVIKDDKVAFEKIVFTPPLGSKVRASERVTVEFAYHNETGEDLFVCIGPVFGENDESSGCSPVKLEQGDGVGKTTFDFGWALVDPSGKRVLMAEFNEETRKSTPLRPHGARAMSRLLDVSGIKFDVYGGSDKTTVSHVIPAKFLPFVDTAFQPSELPVLNVSHAVALAKSNPEAKTIALIEPKIGQISFAVNVDIKRIKKDGTTDVIPGVETFAKEVVLEQVKSEHQVDQLQAWAIDGTRICSSELLVKLSKPAHIIVAPAYTDGKSLVSPYYRAIFRQDLIIIQKTEESSPNSKP